MLRYINLCLRSVNLCLRPTGYLVGFFGEVGLCCHGRDYSFNLDTKVTWRVVCEIMAGKLGVSPCYRAVEMLAAAVVILAYEHSPLACFQPLFIEVWHERRKSIYKVFRLLDFFVDDLGYGAFVCIPHFRP